MPLTTTLDRIRACSPCGLKPESDGTLTGLSKLMAHLGKPTTDDEPIQLETILDSNGIDDAIWCLRAVEQTPTIQRAERLFTVWCARQVQHLMTNQRSLAALDVAARHADGLATDAELAAAWAAAWDAVWDAARDAAGAAALAAAWDAARAAAGAAAWAAARDAWDTAWAAALAVARAAQAEKFRDICRAGEWVA